MDPAWWGIPVVLVVGIGVVVFGWWWDRHRARRADAALKEVTRPIPGHEGATPTYVTEQELADLPPAGAPGDDPAGERSDLGLELAGGALDPAFLNAGSRGVLVDPWVLVVDTHLDDPRLLLEPLARAQRDDRGLVLVARTCTEPVLGTLRANAVTGRVAVLPISVSDTVTLRRAVALTGGLLVPALDLRSGYLPDAVWGTCARWTCDLTTSWVRLAGEDPQPPTGDSQPDVQRS